ncbi:hypothetical protein NBRC116601_15260 [Cognatishimia sp. WU-CL00825]|uniref:hypothetical protein n=1 Tax=Cognatishimia sp. WU-CL00825 TaxID=3127658 RepID=UPI00310320D8
MKALGPLAISVLCILAQPAAAEPCLTLGDLTPDMDARHLAGSVRGCVQEQRFEDAIQVFWAYSNFALFDQQRVRDESAHVAVQELHGWIFSGYSFETINQLKLVITRLRDPEGAFLHETCRAVALNGPPTYRPSYMIKRGMIPRKSDDDWQVAGFDAQKAWENALININGCPASTVR